jgi:HEAT repeat protein
MRAAHIVVAVCLLATVGGCGDVPPPLVVHGKPVDHWVAALRDRDARVRKRAAEALGQAGPADPAVVPALTAAVRDRDAAVRAAAVLCLLRIGPAAREAVPALREVAQGDRDARVRGYAVKALDTIQAEP